MAKLVDFVLQHLIFALFLGYLVIGIIFRHSLFGLNHEAVNSVRNSSAVAVATRQAADSAGTETDLQRPQAAQSGYQFRPMPEPRDSVPGSTSKFESLLKLARTAVKNGDMENAVGYYQSAIGIQNDRPEPFGELGNLFLKSGDMEQAAAAYYEAGIRIPADSQRLQGLLRVLEKISPDTARRLRDKTETTVK